MILDDKVRAVYGVREPLLCDNFISEKDYNFIVKMTEEVVGKRAFTKKEGRTIHKIWAKGRKADY